MTRSATEVRFYTTPYMLRIGQAVVAVELSHDGQGPILGYFVIVTDKAGTWFHEKLRLSSAIPFEEALPAFWSWVVEAARSRIQTEVADPLNTMDPDPRYMISVALRDTDKRVLAPLYSFPQCRVGLAALGEELKDEATKAYVRFLASIRVETIP